MNRDSMLSKDKALILALGAFTILMVGLAVGGGFRSYSPVPFWDMWFDYLGFILRVADGDIGTWWAQVNEHRIVLARALFWVDLKWFGGASVFLIAVNYFLVGASAFMFWRILRDAAATKKPATGEILLGLFVTAWLFQWSQRQNLTWGFQSQFILAQLLPLCALYWLHKSVVEIHAKRYFLVACGFGVASVGTMANGILALPLMAFYALLMRQGVVRVGLLATLSVVLIFLYFHNYYAPTHHGSISQALRENPSGFIQYALLYLGSPFAYLLGQGEVGFFGNSQGDQQQATRIVLFLQYIATFLEPFTSRIPKVPEFGKLIGQAAGLVLVGNSAWFAIKALRKPRELTLQLAMLFFILYIGGTAFGTAGGRLLPFGVDQALSSRYTTPALMAWCALLVFYSPNIFAAIRAGSTKFLLLFAVLALLMINLQRQALNSHDDELFEQKIAALALELLVNDQMQIGRTSPSVESAMLIAKKASAQKLSIFGMYPFRDVREQLGASVRQQDLPVCAGYLDPVEPIEGDTRFVRVTGWIFNPISNTQPEVVRFINSQSKAVGYALIGQPRPDVVAIVIDKKALKSGFRGYLWTDQMGGGTLTLQTESQVGTSCQMQVNVPVALFSPTATKPFSVVN